MPAFRQVNGGQAGPQALGILVPPGRRTLVIMRPRALECDLLLVHPGKSSDRGLAFWEAARHEAAGLAQRLHRALQNAASAEGIRVEALASPAGEGYRVLASVGPFTLIACPRRPGQAYQPLELGTVQEAQHEAGRIAAVLCPEGGAEREIYLNTRNFTR